MLSTKSNSILSTPGGRRCRQLTLAFAALAAFATVAPTAQANPYAGLANYAAGYMTDGNNVPQGGTRYQPGFAGFADYARGYQATHPSAFTAKHGTATVASRTRTKTNRHSTSRNSGASMANYAAGFMTKGNNVPQGGNRYEPGFAGWASFARGYKASHPEDFPG
jgi:hypothetical protein